MSKTDTAPGKAKGVFFYIPVSETVNRCNPQLSWLPPVAVILKSAAQWTWFSVYNTYRMNFESSILKKVFNFVVLSRGNTSFPEVDD